METYVLAGGCFWCLDAVYRRLKGVTKVESGYCGGQGPTEYSRVATGSTGHAEAVRISFNEAIIPPEVILDIFFLIHDPTSLNRQGADIGTQYRSAMFYDGKRQKDTFVDALHRAKKVLGEGIVTELSPLKEFFVAEDEHQDYFNKHPEAGYCQIVIEPKISKARGHYKQWFKEEV